jgi:hypothetical protein
MPQIYDMRPPALLPLRRKACWGIFALKNPKASVGFQPANLGTRGQDATSRLPKPLLSNLLLNPLLDLLIHYLNWKKCTQTYKERTRKCNADGLLGTACRAYTQVTKPNSGQFKKTGPTYLTKILRPVEPYGENQIWKSFSIDNGISCSLYFKPLTLAHITLLIVCIRLINHEMETTWKTQDVTYSLDWIRWSSNPLPECPMTRSRFEIFTSRIHAWRVTNSPIVCY